MDSAVGSNWDDVRKELFTSEEIVESNRWVAQVGERITSRPTAERGNVEAETLVEKEDEESRL